MRLYYQEGPGPTQNSAPTWTNIPYDERGGVLKSLEESTLVPWKQLYTENNKPEQHKLQTLFLGSAYLPSPRPDLCPPSYEVRLKAKALFGISGQANLFIPLILCISSASSPSGMLALCVGTIAATIESSI